MNIVKGMVSDGWQTRADERRRHPLQPGDAPTDNREMVHKALSRLRPRRAQHGFTLVEMMIAVVIIAILTMIALPSYLESVRKGRRSDAVSRLAQVQQAQERWRANNASYATLAQLGIPATVTGGYYTLSVGNVTALGYEATATPLAGTPQASDTRCTTMKVTLNGPNLDYSSTPGGYGTNSPCWSR